MNLNTYVLISFIEGIYVVYMLCFFKTRYSFEFERPLSILYSIGSKLGISQKNLEHTMTSTTIPISHICPFGHWASWLIAAFLIARNYFKILKKSNGLIILLIAIFSLSNINAVIYLLPIYLLELWMFVC